MLSNPTASGTVTEPLVVKRTVGLDVEDVDEAGEPGLHGEEMGGRFVAGRRPGIYRW